MSSGIEGREVGYFSGISSYVEMIHHFDLLNEQHSYTQPSTQERG